MHSLLTCLCMFPCCSCPMVCVVGTNHGAPHAVPLDIVNLQFNVHCHISQAFVDLQLICQYPQVGWGLRGIRYMLSLWQIPTCIATSARRLWTCSSSSSINSLFCHFIAVPILASVLGAGAAYMALFFACLWISLCNEQLMSVAAIQLLRSLSNSH